MRLNKETLEDIVKSQCDEIEFLKALVKAYKISLRVWAPQLKSTKVIICDKEVDLVGEESEIRKQ